MSKKKYLCALLNIFNPSCMKHFLKLSIRVHIQCWIFDKLEAVFFLKHFSKQLLNFQADGNNGDYITYLKCFWWYEEKYSWWPFKNFIEIKIWIVSKKRLSPIELSHSSYPGNHEKNNAEQKCNSLQLTWIWTRTWIATKILKYSKYFFWLIWL